MLDDSALRECDESRSTRYSERHSGPEGRGGVPEARARVAPL